MILTRRNIKEINLDSLIEEKITAGKLEEILFIVPTNRKIRYLKRELISASPSKVVVNIHLETLSTYSQKLLLGDEGPIAPGMAASSAAVIRCWKSLFSAR